MDNRFMTKEVVRSLLAPLKLDPERLKDVVNRMAFISLDTKRPTDTLRAHLSHCAAIDIEVQVIVLGAAPFTDYLRIEPLISRFESRFIRLHSGSYKADLESLIASLL